MSLLIESKKLKRTGYLPAFLAGGFLAAAFPPPTIRHRFPSICVNTGKYIISTSQFLYENLCPDQMDVLPFGFRTHNLRDRLISQKDFFH